MQRGSCLALMLDIAEELLLLSWSISSPIFHLSRETPSEASDGELQRLCEARCSAKVAGRQLFQRNPTQLKPISTANKHDVFSRNLFLHWFFIQASMHCKGGPPLTHFSSNTIFYIAWLLLRLYSIKANFNCIKTLCFPAICSYIDFLSKLAYIVKGIIH